MNKLLYLIPLALFVSCSDDSDDVNDSTTTDNTEDTLSEVQKILLEGLQADSTIAAGPLFTTVTSSAYDPSTVEWVDLGLPSGTLWANCNVGASKPTDYGWYLAWGEQSPKPYYNYDNYFDWDGTATGSSADQMYYGIKKYPYTTFDSSDDVCTQLYGDDSYTPTNEEFNELMTSTTVSFSTISGTDCVIFTAKDGTTQLVMPLAGCYENRTFYSGFINSWFRTKGKMGYYWMNTKHIDGKPAIGVQDAYIYQINKWLHELYSFNNNDYVCFDKFYGVSVRAVKKAS